jgi:hypothetical protein
MELLRYKALSFVENSDRKVFHIDVGDLTPEESIIFLNEFKKELTE